MNPVLHPFCADAWIRKALVDSPDVQAFCAERIHPNRDDFEPEGWPYIVYGGENEFGRWGGVPVIAEGEFAIFAVMRQDQIENGQDVEDFNIPAYMAISAALDAADCEGPYGIVHGCEILRPWIRLYGEPGQKISEMGVVARIHST